MHLAWVCSKQIDGEREIIEHFKTKEFACADGTDRILVSPDLAVVLHDIRNHFNAPVIITSGFRSEQHNNKVGGAKKSTHMDGRAADIVVKGVSPGKVAQYAELLMPEYGGIGEYRTFVHIDVRQEKRRWKGY